MGRDERRRTPLSLPTTMDAPPVSDFGRASGVMGDATPVKSWRAA
jgi:hypothetical protein